MLFNSYTFIFAFLPTVLLLAVLARRWFGLSAAIGITILSSVVFYGWHRPEIVLLLLGSIGVNYLLTGMVWRAPPPAPLSAAVVADPGAMEAEREGGRSRRWWITALAITLNLLLLGYFKYTNFFVDNLEAVTGSEMRVADIALPIGISFYTFQQIAYCADTYAGKVRERDFLSYALFISFFPQLIAGPIVHHSDLTRQFRLPSFARPSTDDVLTGLALFSVGLFKKKIIADSFAAYATPVFIAADGGASVEFAQAWQAALGYTFQIYFDFSGYSDMALGLARMFGIRLPMNFFSPYKSVSIIAFWRRWHITLSHFLRDYLYIPLGGNRRGQTRRWINLALTMLLGGLWHGANWNFVVWGGLHGLYLVLANAWRAAFPGLAQKDGFRGGDADGGRGLAWRVNAVAGWAVTFLAVVVAWVFFRATTFGGATSILAGMFGLSSGGAVAGGATGAPVADTAAAGAGTASASPDAVAAVVYDAPVDPVFWLWSAGALLVAVALPNTMEIFSRVRISVEEVKAPSRAFGVLPLIFRPNLLWLVAIGVLAGVAVFYQSPTTEFLYWQF